MQSIQIDGTFTYLENVKTLKIGDKIKLVKNPNNRLNSEAVAAHKMDGKKIGYIPFKANQIDMNGKYTVSKIKLVKDNPQLYISREYENSNIIKIYPKNKSNKIIACDNIELKQFEKFLLKSGVNINKIGITFMDTNFIDIIIKSDELNVFHTVTKKYYEENVFIYDEFFNFGLMPRCIYQPFLIHRLEVYIEKHYKPIDKTLKSKKLKSIDLSDIKIEKSTMNMEEIENLITNMNEDGLAYNHDMKLYCNVDYYDDMNIIHIVNNDEMLVNLKLTNSMMLEAIVKAILGKKDIINILVLNETNGVLHKFTINEEIKDNFISYFLNI